MKKIILDLCGGTGAWSKPYKEAGYDVRLITLPEWDTRLYPSKPSTTSRRSSNLNDIVNHKPVYGILAAPVCTVFANSGAVHFRSDKELLEALSLVDACLRIVWVLKPKFWVMENPVGKLTKWIGKPVMTFQPCDYGDPYTKRTLLWGQFNIPKKTPVKPTEGSKLNRLYGGRSDRTKEMRSVTPQGFAKAFYESNK